MVDLVLEVGQEGSYPEADLEVVEVDLGMVKVDLSVIIDFGSGEEGRGLSRGKGRRCPVVLGAPS